MPAVKRPFGVTLVGLVIIISGILAVIGGIVGFFDGVTLGWGVVALILDIIIGIIYIALARGIFAGSAGARAIIALITVFYIIVGIIHLFDFTVLGVWQIIIGLVILALLFGGRAREFFA